MGYLDYAGLQYLWSKLKEKFAPKSHSHDDRYYTESEMDGKLNSKVNNNEAGANGLINKLSTADGIPNDATVFISQHNDGKTASYYRRPISTLWTYIKSKADSVYQPKGSYAASSHTHDDRYYTESEMNTKLSAKSENIVLASDTNLNNITTPGFYSCGGGNKITNKPNNTDAIGLIVTHNASGGYYTQILTTSSNANTYRRTCLNGTWSGWTQDKYTDTNTWRGIQNNLTSDSTSDSLSAAQGKALKGLIDGKAPNEHTHQYLSLYGARPTNINFTKSTNGTGAMFHFVATSSTTTGKPPDDSSILQLNWDNSGGWDSQLALSTTAKPHVYYRNQQNGTWGNWSTLLDNLNYTDYAAKKEHTHSKSQITDFPASLKNPTALTIQTNGAIAATYDGSAAKTVNITKSNIGLGNVDNTADANKSVKYATSAGSASTATKATTAGTADKANSVDWSKVQNKPSSYPPSSHSHAYLPLGGGTISGQIKRDVGCSWIYDRDNAIVYGTSSGTSTGYHPVIGQKTPSGAWTIGTYSDERLIFDYTTDANKTAGTNNGTQVYLPAQAGTIITSATIGSQSVNYANSAGNATNAANATTATKLSSNAGSSVQPVYFSGGKPVAIGYTISSSVPANAKFTDTTYGVASSSSNGLMSSTDKTKLDDFSRVINFQKQIKLTTDWLDTGIAGNSLDTGTYVVQVSGFNSSHTQLYSEIYSGVMSWYSGTTNSGNSSEIFLHNAGLADNNNAIYLRTLRVAGSKTLKLQIACKVAATGTDILTFKFRRLI
jgi:hypothetical protein